MAHKAVVIPLLVIIFFETLSANNTVATDEDRGGGGPVGARNVVAGSGVDASAEDGGCGGVGGDRWVNVASLDIERGGRVSGGRVGDYGD